MNTEEISLYFDELESEFEKTYDHLVDDLAQIRAGRANPKIVEKVMVDYYGTMTPLNQMATISVPEARMITISLWDISQIKAAVKAIETANLGLNPSDDGRVIRLIIPQLTEERRKEYVKDIKAKTENARVVCRNARRDCLDEFKKMKKESLITEDELAQLEKDVQKRLDSAIERIDKASATKEKDIMEV